MDGRGTPIALAVIMMYVSDETFGPLLFEGDQPLLLVCGRAQDKNTEVALDVARRFVRYAPFVVRLAFLSTDAGPSLRAKLGLGKGTYVLFFRDAREVLRLKDKVTREQLLREIQGAA